MSTQTHNIEELLGNARWMERFAHTLCQDGDDLAQDAWVAALEKGAPRPGQERAWFSTVMRNSFRMRLRGSQRRTQREQAAPEPQQPPIPDVLTQRLLVERRLGDHLLRLTESQREVILLHFYDGMSAADIGRQLGVPATTIRSRLERSLELLRDALDDESDGDRGAWRLALAPLLDVPPASAIPGTALGVVAMSAKTMIAIGLAFLLLIGVAVKMTLATAKEPVLAGGEKPAAGTSASLSNQTSRATNVPTPSETPVAAAPSLPSESPPSARFKDEPLDQEWATAQEKAISDRLDELDNPFLDLLGIECQSTCCKLSFSYEYLKDYGDGDPHESILAYEAGQVFAFDAGQLDLQTSVGFGSWSDRMETGSDFYTCFDRSQDTAELQLKGTIRIDERKRLLNESMAELVQCLPKAEQSAEINVLAVFHEDGTVTVRKRESDSELKTCIAAIVRQWQTVKSDTHHLVNLPLMLAKD